jgi:ABC-type glycerol-3-phosphate transport system permease component
MTATAQLTKKRRPADARRPRDLLVLIPIAVILAIIVFPVFWMVLTSLRPTVITQGLKISQWFSNLSFASYGELFSTSNFGRYIFNSALVAVVTMICTVLIASLASYAFSRYTFKLRTALLIVVISTQLMPFVVLITPMYTLFSGLQLLNSYLGLIIAYVAMTLPFAVYLLMGYFDTIPRGLDEAAKIDGCSPLGVIFRVVLPVAWPGLVTVAVTTFIAAWEEFLFAQVLMTDDNLKTVQVGLAGFFGEYNTDWSLVMCASVVAAIPTIILFITVQRRLVVGMAAGSVKE